MRRLIASLHQMPHDYRVLIGAGIFACWCVGLVITFAKVQSVAVRAVIFYPSMIALVVVLSLLWLKCPAMPW